MMKKLAIAMVVFSAAAFMGTTSARAQATDWNPGPTFGLEDQWQVYQGLRAKYPWQDPEEHEARVRDASTSEIRAMREALKRDNYIDRYGQNQTGIYVDKWSAERQDVLQGMMRKYPDRDPRDLVNEIDGLSQEEIDGKYGSLDRDGYLEGDVTEN